MTDASVIATPAASDAPATALRAAFSFPVLIAFLVSLLGVLTVRSRFNDPDMWWHLRTGKVIWTTHVIPITDIYSFTTNHHAYVPQEWLSQVLIYGAYKLGGYFGLMVWLCLATIAILVTGYLLCALYSRNAKVAFIGAMTIWLFATIGLSIRPQMIGYLLLLVELLLIHLGRTRSPRWFWGLPPLFAVWVNCHASFFLGFSVTTVLFVCSFSSFRAGSLIAPPWEPRRRKMLGISLLLSAAALFLNPVNIRQILYPLDTILHQPIALSQSEEWLPPHLTQGRGLALLAVLGGMLLVIIVQRAELYLDEFVLLALATWLAVGHQRMLFAFGILAAPIVSRLLARSWDAYDPAQDHPLPNAVLIACTLLVMLWGFPSRQNLQRQVDEGNPVQATQYIQSHPLTGNMLNEYTYGGYLIWALPDHPVFVDGRSDVFEATGVLSRYGKWAMLATDPNQLLNQYNISFCLLSRSSPMAHVLPLLPNWKNVYSDNMSTIFIRTSNTSL